MVVDEAVVASLRSGKSKRTAVFVASCAERMTQFFTGLRGGENSRNNDIDFYVGVVDELWGLDSTSVEFAARVDVLNRFLEMQPSEEELVDPVETYSFYSVLTVRYAALYRATGDLDNAVKCAHANLTAMGQLDQNADQTGFFEDEHRRQRNVVSDDSIDVNSLVRLRESDRAAARDRFMVLESRLRIRPGADLPGARANP